MLGQRIVNNILGNKPKADNKSRNFNVNLDNPLTDEFMNDEGYTVSLYNDMTAVFEKDNKTTKFNSYGHAKKELEKLGYR